MTPRDPHPGDVDPVLRIQRMLATGDQGTALAVLEEMLPGLTGVPRAHALVLRTIGLYNTGSIDALVAAMDHAFDAVRAHPEPFLRGHLCAIAALTAHRRRALDQAVTYLVHGQRALRSIETTTEPLAWAWYDLAMAYSYLGFHGYAITAHERALEVGRDVGVPMELLVGPGVRLRGAVLHDHHGDTESCVRILRDLVVEMRQHCVTGTIERVRITARLSWAYAAARLAALGEPIDVDPRPHLDPAHAADAPRLHELSRLGQICLAISAGRPAEALALLNTITVTPETLGPAEVPRLLALAHLRAGDHRRAYDADRRAFRLASEGAEKIREVFVEGIAARLDHEDLRRRVARYADEALTDPLTGLPNRRHLEQYVAAMVQRGEQAVVGVCDLDGFKAVNTVHGHLSGDVVLQRVGEIIMNVLRRGDFLARYGGDEFVVVLPKTGLDEAAEVARRIVAAVGGADWSSLVPGVPVAVSVGWAEVAGPRMELRQALREAFEAADRAMLRAKTRAHSRAS